MLTRRGQRTPTANRLLYLLGGVGALLIVSILGLTMLVLAQPDAPAPLATGGGTPITAATPLSIGDRPTSWTVRMTTHPSTGQPEGVVDDERVYRMVRDDYLAGKAWFASQVITLTQTYAEAASGKPNTDRLEEYLAVPRLYEIAGIVRSFREEGRVSIFVPTGRQIEVRNFSADGQRVYLGDSWSGGTTTWYDLDTHEIVAEEGVPAGMFIVTMAYDRERGRWRAAAVRVVDVEGIKGRQR